MYNGVPCKSHRLFFLLVFLLFGSGLAAQVPNQAPNIDLRGHDFLEIKETNLNEEWSFHWQELLDPLLADTSKVATKVNLPHLWNEDPDLGSFGYASYITTVYLPENSPDLALKLPDMYTSYSLYINGDLVAQNGQVSTDAQNYKPYWLPMVVPLDSFREDSLTLVLQIANFEHYKGGIRLPIVIGNKDHLISKWRTTFGLDIFLSGCILMIGLIFLGLYMFGRHEISMLSFALVCFFFSYRAVGTELYALHNLLPDLPWMLTVKLEYLTLFGIGLCFSIFVLRLYPNEVSKKLLYPFAGFFGTYGVAALILPPYYTTKFINLFFLVFLVFSLYITWVYIKAVKNNQEGSRIALASTAFVFVVLILNLLAYKTLIQENILFYYSGLFCFFFLQSLVLMYRYTNSLTRAKVEAEEAAKAKSQFLSTISHEIRTPLNAVIGLSDLLQQSDSEKEQLKYASIIKESGHNLLELVNRILEYSKFESLGTQKRRELVHLSNLLDDIIVVTKPLTEDKSITITTHIQDNVPKWVHSDSTQLKQVLVNLVGNAIKFTEEGSIHLKLERFSDPDKKGNLLFTIKDTGKGIAEEDTHRLFQEFSQVDTGTTREYGGTGLGLALSEKLVDALDGEIWFESSLGKGSVFYFTISADEASQIPTEMQSSEYKENDSTQSDIKTLNVLVAEDNLLNQKVLLKILERNNIEADIAKDGKEALKIATENTYDLIFMDMEMPVMDGLEATREIRKLDLKGEQPVIIAVTANAFHEHREICLEAGMNDFITKPISTEAITTLIHKWF